MRLLPHTLRGRLLLFALLSALPALIAAWIGVVRLNEQARIHVLHEIDSIAKQSVERVLGTLDSTENLLALIGAAHGAGAIDAGHCPELLRGAIASQSRYANLALADVHGNVWCSAVSHDKPVNIADRDYFLDALLSGQPALSRYYVGRITGVQSLSMSMPLRGADGRIEGVVFAALLADGLIQQGASASPIPISTLIVDRSGTVVSRHPDGAAWAGRKLTDRPLIRALLAGQSGPAEMQGEDGVERRYALLPVTWRGSHVLYAAFGADLDPIAAAARRELATSLGAIVAATVLILLLAGLGINLLVTSRVRHLTEAARRVGGGDYDARIAMHRDEDELSVVEKAFNEMGATIADREYNLRIATERARLLAEATNDALWDWDIASRIFWCNEGFVRLMGRDFDPKRDDFQTWLELIHPADRERVRESLAQTLASDVARWESVHRIVTADGHIRTVSQRVRILRDGQGKATRLVGGNVDITERVRVEQDLREAQRLADLGSWSWDAASNTLHWSEEMFRICGWEGVRTPNPAERLRMHSPEDMALFGRNVKQAMVTGMPFVLEAELIRPSGERRWVAVRAQVELDSQGQRTGIFGTMQDITERHAQEEQLRLLRRAVEAAPNGIAIADALQPDLPLVYVNSAFEHITGYRSDEIMGRNCRFLNLLDPGQPGLAEIRAALREKREGHAILRNFRKNGELFLNEVLISPVRNEAGHITHFVGVQSDVTDREAFQQRLAHQATHDILTGLPNRSLLADRVQQAIERAETGGPGFLILLIDLDRFKLINDSLGHEAGDEVLRTLATRLQQVVRTGDTVARFGGDEFVVVMQAGGHDAPAVERIAAIFRKPIPVHDVMHVVTASIGVARFPRDGLTVDILLRRADLAMYQAKSLGRNTAHFFDEGLDRGISARLDMESLIRIGLERNEFHLQYQPQIDARTGTICGLEALLRWNHPERGAIPPAAFIPVAEESGLILELGHFVMREACRQGAAWRDAGLAARTIAINVSALQFRRDEVLPALRALQQLYRFEAGFLEVEVTESLLMDGEQALIATLETLRQMGISISIDDFGTGYSSLAYLKRLPIDRLKIDRSFVKDIADDPNDATICSTIIALAHGLGLQVIAEGVETEAQMHFLSGHGCDMMQGYYFCKPLDAVEIETMLRTDWKATGRSDVPL